MNLDASKWNRQQHNSWRYDPRELGGLARDRDERVRGLQREVEPEEPVAAVPKKKKARKSR